MSRQSFEALALIVPEESIRTCITEIRRDPKQLDEITENSFPSNNPIRQTFRRAMRYAVDAPDIEWEGVLTSVSAEALKQPPSAPEAAAPLPGSCSAWVL